MQTITPSKHDPWLGGMDHAFTNQQRDVLKRDIKAIAASRKRTKAPETFNLVQILEPKIGDDFMPGHRTIMCPAIAMTKDRGRVLVIAPDGTKQWVPFK